MSVVREAAMVDDSGEVHGGFTWASMVFCYKYEGLAFLLLWLGGG